MQANSYPKNCHHRHLTWYSNNIFLILPRYTSNLWSYVDVEIMLHTSICLKSIHLGDSVSWLVKKWNWEWNLYFFILSCYNLCWSSHIRYSISNFFDISLGPISICSSNMCRCFNTVWEKTFVEVTQLIFPFVTDAFDSTVGSS